MQFIGFLRTLPGFAHLCTKAVISIGLISSTLTLSCPQALGQAPTPGSNLGSKTGLTQTDPVTGDFAPSPLPEEKPRTHEQNSTLSMSPIKLGALIQIARMRPIELDASQDIPISLQDVLDYTMQNSLDIQISRESYRYQQAQLASQIAGFAPNLNMGYTYTKTHILDPETHSTSKVFAPRVIYPVFTGGSVVYGALIQMYRTRGWKNSYRTTVNDTILNVYKAYTQLVLNHALLKIRLKAVQVDKEQLAINEQKYASGTGTKYEIVQSKSQLANDEQALLAQQITTRQSAQTLGYTINMPLSVNMVPRDESLSEARLISPDLSIDTAIKKTLENRPELRQYEMFRLAADRSVQQAGSGLYPTVAFSQVYNQADTVATQSGSNGNNGSGTTAGAGVYGGSFKTRQNAFSINWTLQNMGLSNAANIVGARALARQSLMQANQELQLVRQNVRSSYIAVRSARQKIDSAAAAVDAAGEALRMAMIRLKVGNGTNLEVIQAENTYIADLYAQAQAIIESNQAQAQLLHDMGMISAERLLAKRPSL